MERRGVPARLGLVAAIVVAGWSAGACTRCVVDCAAPSRVEEVVAEVRAVDAGRVQVRTEAGESLDIRIVGGSADELVEGRSYRFPVLHLVADPVVATTATSPDAPATDAEVSGAAVQPTAFFPDDCDCTDAYIADLDGDVIDPGIDVPFRRLAVTFLAASFLLVTGWALTRWYREQPL